MPRGYLNKRFEDHTTPWRCSVEKCKVCKDKPTYDDYMKKYKEK